MTNYQYRAALGSAAVAVAALRGHDKRRGPLLPIPSSTCSVAAAAAVLQDITNLAARYYQCQEAPCSVQWPLLSCSAGHTKRPTTITTPLRMSSTMQCNSSRYCTAEMQHYHHLQDHADKQHMGTSMATRCALARCLHLHTHMHKHACLGNSCAVFSTTLLLRASSGHPCCPRPCCCAACRPSRGAVAPPVAHEPTAQTPVARREGCTAKTVSLSWHSAQRPAHQQ